MIGNECKCGAILDQDELVTGCAACGGVVDDANEDDLADEPNIIARLRSAPGGLDEAEELALLRDAADHLEACYVKMGNMESTLRYWYGVAERLRVGMHDAAKSLETLTRDAGKRGTMLEDMAQVRGYANSRAAAREVLAGSKPQE